jgi:hypothetical protein
MPFESQFNQYSATLSAITIQGLGAEPPAPTTIIRTTDAWEIQVELSAAGILVPALGGTWHVTAYLESMGPGPDLDLPNVFLDTDEIDVPLNGGANYTFTISVPAGAVPVRPEARSSAYKLVVVVSYTDLLNNPSRMAGFVEGSMLQFYQDVP